MKKFFMLLKRPYRYLRNRFWACLALMAPTQATILKCRKHLGKDFDLHNPVTLNEKLQWLKLNTYRHNPLVTMCADKYRVREYVTNKGYAHILNEMFFVWDRPEDIDWDKLPEKFVLKCNHGCGDIIICHDKDKQNKKEAIANLKKWIKHDYGLPRVEYSYEDIQRKIICEKLIETEDGKPPKDYKFFCSYGKVKFLLVGSDEHDHNRKRDYYTENWKWLPIKRVGSSYTGESPKPKRFDEMVACAEKLSEEFPIVRVDLYCEFEKIIFGELTFLCGSGIMRFDPPEYDKQFGELFDVSNELNTKV